MTEGGAEEAAEARKAAVRAKVEHPFPYVKRHFGYAKVRYRGVAKNMQRIALLLGFSNLLISGRCGELLTRSYQREPELLHHARGHNQLQIRAASPPRSLGDGVVRTLPRESNGRIRNIIRVTSARYTTFGNVPEVAGMDRGARARTRTGTARRPTDFKSVASTKFRHAGRGRCATR